MNKFIFLSVVSLLGLGLVISTGCQPSESETIRRMAEKTVHEQAQLNLKISEATESLVRADSEARLSMIEAHDQLQLKLQSERELLNQRRNDLDSLKDQIEYDRRRAPIIAESIQSVGGILACLCPLFLAAYVLYSMNKTIESDQERIVNQFLLEELTSDSSVLLSSPVHNRLDESEQHLLATLDSESGEAPF